MSAASRLPALVCLAACLLAPLARAAPGEGSVDEPVEIDALPYFVRGDTSTSPSSAIDLYDCALDLDESGPERIFRFELPAEARVTAWVEGDIEGLVDLDVHLLDELLIDDMQVASGCLARGHTIAEAQMSAGTRWVVVDSYEGEALAGEFVLRVFAVGEAWSEIPIGEGVVWRGRRFVDEDGPQVLNLIDIDPAVPGVSLEVFDTDMCATVAELAASHSRARSPRSTRASSPSTPAALRSP